MVVGWIWTVGDWIAHSVEEVVLRLTELSMPSVDTTVPGAIMGALAIGNTFLPLSELVSFLILYVAIRAALSIYRLIKSWIPTLS